jgi:hypothetical protein
MILDRFNSSRRSHHAVHNERGSNLCNNKYKSLYQRSRDPQI